MSLNHFFNGIDSVEKTGRFFVALAERLGDGTLDANDDALRLARVLGVPLPPELMDASISSSDETRPDEKGKLARAESGSPRILIIYSDIDHPGSGQTELKFKKCFKVCQTVAGAKICAEVCIDIHIGLSGAGGKLTATVSVTF